MRIVKFWRGGVATSSGCLTIIGKRIAEKSKCFILTQIHWMVKSVSVIIVCFCRVEIAEFSYQGFHSFLFYLYTDRIDAAVRTAEDGIGNVHYGLLTLVQYTQYGLRWCLYLWCFVCRATETVRLLWTGGPEAALWAVVEDIDYPRQSEQSLCRLVSV